MKVSFIFPIMISVLVGALCGKFVYWQYQNQEMVLPENEKIYFFQQGVYTIEEVKDENILKLPCSLTIFENDKHYVYVAITNDEENKEKIRKLFQDLGINLYQKEIEVTNLEFLSNLEQYDILLKNAVTNDEIISVLKVILASYEESVLMR